MIAVLHLLCGQSFLIGQSNPGQLMLVVVKVQKPRSRDSRESLH
jgi:hypothetical protein